MAVTEATLKPVPETFASIEQAVEAIARGEIVIVVDAPDRENEGDFVMAADKVTPEAVNFMITHGRGLLCMPMSVDGFIPARPTEWIKNSASMERAAARLAGTPSIRCTSMSLYLSCVQLLGDTHRWQVTRRMLPNS